MTTTFRRAASAVVSVLLGTFVASSALANGSSAVPFSKDTGPANAKCDGMVKGSDVWTTCVGSVSAGLHGEEAFYAGYWLAKTGHYDQALGYLRYASQSDARVLTYIGFATRKLGNVEGALPFYDRALVLNPDYSVARAYLGEAFLSRGERTKAQGQLDEIGRRCGLSCAEYADLARHTGPGVADRAPAA